MSDLINSRRDQKMKPAKRENFIENFPAQRRIFIETHSAHNIIMF